MVSIADATLASPQPFLVDYVARTATGFNRRRDACFPATPAAELTGEVKEGFNRRRDACFPATPRLVLDVQPHTIVSIADATLASPQHPELSTVHCIS